MKNGLLAAALVLLAAAIVLCFAYKSKLDTAERYIQQLERIRK